ncbi:MAG: hypothetical protein JWR09_1807, partial [Mucilaginibacter sp.]|nr:hypothetical protein [Mucilaginibacter sp.]
FLFNMPVLRITLLLVIANSVEFAFVMAKIRLIIPKKNIKPAKPIDKSLVKKPIMKKSTHLK